MTLEKIAFTPYDNKPSSKLNVDFRLIKGHKSSKEIPNKPALLNLIHDQGSYLFEFDDYSDRELCRDFVAKGMKFHEEGGSEQLSKAETDRRMKLLTEDIELKSLFTQFVMGGVLSESEFWASRKKMLDENGSKKPKQRMGLKSDMIFNVKPSSDGQLNRVTFNLSPEMIRQIFAEKPAVRQAYLNFVPNKMSEKDFWTKYWRAQYLHSTKNIVVAAAEDEELAVFLKQDPFLASETKLMVNLEKPTTLKTTL